MPENDNTGVAMLMFSVILFMVFIFTENLELLLTAIIAALFGMLI